MTERFKSVTHGTCALSGKHTSEEYVTECPALGANAQERLQQFRDGRQGGDSGSPHPLSASPRQSGRNRQVSITVQPQRHVGGRPRKHPDAKARNREANRAYRERKKVEVIA